MTLKQTIQKFKEQRRNVMQSILCYQFRLKNFPDNEYPLHQLERDDIFNTIEFLDQKNILLQKIIEELQEVTHL